MGHWYLEMKHNIVKQLVIKWFPLVVTAHQFILIWQCFLYHAQINNQEKTTDEKMRWDRHEKKK